MTLEQLKALEATATRGPWEWDGRTIDSKVEPWGEILGLVTKGATWNDWQELKLSKEDAELIVALRNHAVRLIAVAEAAMLVGRCINAGISVLKGSAYHTLLGEALAALEAP